MKTALVIGATGLTGRYITHNLLAAEAYGQVVVFSRRALPEQHPKLVNHVVDFDHVDDWAELVNGDDLFSALGTTLKAAGSKAAQYKVDYTYQADVMAAAASNGVQRLFLVSSPQATSRSPFFYNRMKGELDEFAASQGFATLVYFKPSIIEGERDDSRPGEKVGGLLAGAIAKCVPGGRRYRPIKGEELGRAIVNCACSELTAGTHTYELGEIFDLLPRGEH